MSITELKLFVEMAATIIGISGGLLGLYKYLSNKREKELREWQKVVVYKVFRQNEMQPLGFTDILVKYRSEAQAFEDVDLKKKEVSENSLRRVLLELANSNVLSMEPSDSFRLKVAVEKPDPVDQFNRVNQELVKMIGAPNGFIYTLDEVIKEIAPKVGIEIPLFRTSLKQSIAAGIFVENEQGKIAFAR